MDHPRAADDEPNPWKLVKAIQELKADNDNEAVEITALRDEVAELGRELRGR